MVMRHSLADWAQPLNFRDGSNDAFMEVPTQLRNEAFEIIKEYGLDRYFDEVGKPFSHGSGWWEE